LKSSSFSYWVLVLEFSDYENEEDEEDEW